MTSIIKNTAILTIFSLIAYNNAESTDCRNFVCPALQENIICPPDSKSIVIEPNYKSPHEYISTNFENINNHNIVENVQNPHILHTRSLGKTRRESIKIVPGHYNNKRSIQDNNLKDDELRLKCCPQHKCICKWENCEIPKCDGELIPIGNLTTEQPGDCCPVYSCQLKPDCNILPDEYAWLQPCHRCQCISNQTFCLAAQCPEEKTANCNIENSSKYYLHGEQWTEDQDPCTTCTCFNSKVKCETSICQTPSCPKIIKLPDECCPTCDYNGTHFCEENIKCEIACEFDFVKSETGCKLCKCVQSTTTTTTTSTTMISTTPNENHTNPYIQFISNKMDEKDQLIRSLLDENMSLKRHIEEQNQKDCYLYAFISILIVALILLAFKYYFYQKRNRMYKTVPSSVDSNLNTIPKAK